jgi:hypothetical protein
MFDIEHPLVVVIRASALRLIESIPISTRYSAMSG